MSTDDEAHRDELSDEELDIVLARAAQDLLDHLRGVTDPTATLLAIMACQDPLPAAENELWPEQGGHTPGSERGVTLYSRLNLARQRMDTTLVGTVLPEAVLDEWEARTIRHGERYITATAPLELLTDVLGDFEEIGRLCEQRHPIDRHRRLHRITAKLAGLIGMLLINLSRWDLARSFFETARRAAEETEEPALRAWVMLRQSMLPHYYGDPLDSLKLARAAGDLADKQVCAVRAMAPVAELRAKARLAQQGRDASFSARDDVLAAAEEARTRAETVLAAVNGSDPVFGYTHRQMFFHLGEALVELGYFRDGYVYLTQALKLYDHHEQLDRTLIQLDRAFCRVAGGEPEETLRLATQATRELAPEYRWNIVQRRVRQLESAVALLPARGDAGSAPD
ncbi:hypothetical protein GCM10022419_118170 [Nonomuraea rosea]|uniref:XRE family transcriptional regulator n=1 Tax=Nonomuraea rosea TaxID=638574 RepID=A0ABP6ZL95_9ACTN